MKAQDKLRSWLLGQDLRYEDFALLIDCDKAHISRWVTGKHIPHKRMRRELSNITGIDFNNMDDWKLLPAASPPSAATDGGNVAQGFNAQGVSQG